MAYARTSLVVLTLLQQCRAEISDKQPEWYSANVINDGFQPKPISEIFSTESSFSSTNPIIVLSKSDEVPDEIAFLSTLPPLTRTSSRTSEGFTNILPISSTSATEAPLVSSSPPPPSPTTAVPVHTQPHETSAPPILPDVPPVLSEIQPVIPLVTTEPPMVQPVLQEVQQPSMEQPIPQLTQLVIPAQPVQPAVQSVPNNSEQPSRSQSSQNQSQQIRLELVPQVQTFRPQHTSNPTEVPIQHIVTQLPNLQSSTLSPQSNYFLIYQQAPQNIQNFPAPAGFSQSATGTTPSIPQPMPTVSALSVPSSPPQTVPPSSSSPPQTVRPIVTSSSQTVPPATSTAPRTVPPTRSSQTVPRINNTMPTTRPLPNTSRRAVNRRNTTRTASTVTTPLLSTTTPIAPYPLRIRVIAPSGSITNVKINPTTTTKKPKTPRTRKPKPKARKNNYDVCVDSCKGRRDPICAAPISPGVIEANNLKGFPSICHMACHNSFRKDTYEKLVDGRCGKLRTRIRTVDSNTKLKRDELIKAEYTLDNTGPKTIVEFSGSIN